MCSSIVDFIFSRIIHDHGFSPEDYRQYKPLVFSNTIYSLLTIIRAMDKLRIDFENDERLVRFRYTFLVFIYLFLSFCKPQLSHLKIA